MPRTFATNPKPVPYPVIPLAVIGIDMIIATLPLAGLLIWQILQSMGLVGSANVLLAKNILWWFGHPVVYLLLFPAVAVYYWLIPRYAGRDLVAGHVIAIAWTVAVIANVLVWAHHLYLDYPSGTPQAQINTAMQPITFALVLPSALSLYSLAFTIYRSRFRWTPASTALFFGLVGWLLAGLSGVVNATIALDVAVHNTLWIVGHFHHMAMLNIGLLIFGAIYALLPELSGKALYSEKLAWVHVWTTFVAGMIVFGLWDGPGPRRRAAALGGAAVAVRHHHAHLARLRLHPRRGAGAVLLERPADACAARAASRPSTSAASPSRRSRSKEWSVHAAEGALVVVVLAARCGLRPRRLPRRPGARQGRRRHRDDHARRARAAPSPATPRRGKAVFASAGCGGCHTLAAAGANGNVGPNLDATKPSEALVVAARHERQGRDARRSRASSASSRSPTSPRTSRSRAGK